MYNFINLKKFMNRNFFPAKYFIFLFNRHIIVHDISEYKYINEIFHIFIFINYSY